MYLCVFISGIDVAIKGPPKASVSPITWDPRIKRSVSRCLLASYCCDKNTDLKQLMGGGGFVCFIYPRSQSTEGSHSRKQGQNTGGKWPKAREKCCWLACSSSLPSLLSDTVPDHLPRSGIAYPPIAHHSYALTHHWAGSHAAGEKSRKCPVGSPPGQFDHGIFSFEISSSQMILTCAKLT